MSQPCQSCQTELTSHQPFCPNCGAINPAYKPDSSVRQLKKTKGSATPAMKLLRLTIIGAMVLVLINVAIAFYFVTQKTDVEAPAVEAKVEKVEGFSDGRHEAIPKVPLAPDPKEAEGGAARFLEEDGVGVLLLAQRAPDQLPQGQEAVVIGVPEDNKALYRKLRQVVECANTIADKAYLGRQRYLTWADPEKGPAIVEGKEIHGPYTIKIGNKCKVWAEQAAVTPPLHGDIDRAIKAWAVTTEPLFHVLLDANDYYMNKKYVADAMAHGRDLHPKLLAGWEAFAKADRDLVAVLAPVLRLLEGREVIRARRENPEVEGLIRDSLVHARMTMEQLVAIESGASLANVGENLNGLKREAGRIAALDAGRNHEELSVLTTFVLSKRLTEFADEGLSWIDRKSTNLAFTKEELMRVDVGEGAMVSASPDRVRFRYLRLVDTSNSLTALDFLPQSQRRGIIKARKPGE